MTAPINNANLTSPATRDTQQSGARAEQSRAAGLTSDATPKPPTKDTLKLSQSASEVAPDNGLASPQEAQAVLARTKHLFSAGPDAAIAAFGKLDAASVGNLLHQTA